jgi:NAD(P)-dependent dehydrogenase (short-subunit alcohol dehydrogenase family)
MPTLLVTGSNRGIGLELCRQYAAAGWNVLAGCRAPSAATELNRLRSETLRVIELDKADPACIRRVAEDLRDQSIDLLLNNAGVIGIQSKSLGQLEPEGLIETLRVNTVGPLLLCQALLEPVASSHRRQMVAVTSGMGSIGDGGGGYYAYRCSKAALNMAMHTLARDLAPRGITVCVINPGWVKTDMGGSDAKLSTEQSVQAMKTRLDALGIEDSGKFLDYKGGEWPW